MLRNMTGALISHEKIHTTDARAKEIRRVVERLITKAIRLGDLSSKAKEAMTQDEKRRILHVRRTLARFLPRFWKEDDEILDLHHKMIHVIAPRFQGRPGGYTRITKLGPRLGDNAPVSQIELLDSSK